MIELQLIAYYYVGHTDPITNHYVGHTDPITNHYVGHTDTIGNVISRNINYFYIQLFRFNGFVVK